MTSSINGRPEAKPTDFNPSRYGGATANAGSSAAYRAAALVLPPLPPDRTAAVEAGLVYHQEILAHRDQLRTQVAALEVELAGMRAEADVRDSQINALETRAATLEAHRDQAVADRSVYEALFVSMMAQLRAFRVPVEPLVPPAPDDE